MKKQGFTLIELMIVVAIIVFLASIMIPRLFKYTSKANQAEVAMMLASLHTAEQTYFAEHGTYTTKLTGPDSIDWQPEGNFQYTYGFFFPGAQEGVNYFVGKLKTPAESLGTGSAEGSKFVASAAGKVGDKIDVWTIDQARKLVQNKKVNKSDAATATS